MYCVCKEAGSISGADLTSIEALPCALQDLPASAEIAINVTNRIP